MSSTQDSKIGPVSPLLSRPPEEASLSRLLERARVYRWRGTVASRMLSLTLSPQLAALFGTNGETFELDLDDVLERRCHANDASRARLALATAMSPAAGDPSFRVELRLWNTKERRWWWCLLMGEAHGESDSNTLHFDGALQPLHDSVALQETLAEKRRADQRAQIMLDATPLCANFWDEDFRNVDCNQEAVNLFGLKDKQEYLDRFADLSPKFQPDGRPTSEKAAEMVSKAFREGYARFEWLHQTLKGEPIPAEITLRRVKSGDGFIVAGYTRDLRELKATMAKKQEADERAQIMLDATPLCVNFWDEGFNNVDCNQEAVALFDLKNKQEYLARFFDLSPEFQPDGRRTSEKAGEMIQKAFAEGFAKFEWMHQKLNGDPVPAEITLRRVKRGEGYIVAGYTRDLRELKATLAKKQEADERAQIMLDATPLCVNFWDESFKNVDCNQEAVHLFGLKNRQEYLDRFFELSPEFQPDGRRSAEKASEMIHMAFTEGFAKFEWMHQKLDGEPIPAEITLRRVKRGDSYIVVGYTRDLRELKATMAKKQEADERTQLMLDATPLCVNLWDENFNNVDCNQEAVNLFDLKSKREYLDRFFELSPEFQPDGRRSAEKAVEMITAAARTGTCVFQWMHQKLNGEPMPSEITLRRIKHGDGYIIAGYTRDLRQLKAAMADLENERAFLKQVMASSPVCFTILVEGVARFTTPFTEEFLGLDLGGALSDYFLDPRDALQLFSDLDRDKTLNWRPVTLRAANGKIRDMLANMFFTTYEGQRGVMTWLVDVTDMKNAERELRRARDVAEEATRSKSGFLANMSYELRTPMNAIMGLTHLLMRTDATPQQREYLNKTEQSSRALLRIIDDILDLSSFEAGEVLLQDAPFALAPLLQDFKPMLRRRLDENNLVLEVQQSKALPKALRGDQQRLMQVLQNLVENAIKHTRDGRVTIAAAEKERDEAGFVVQFSVADTGEGMSAETVAKVFMTFSEVDFSMSRRAGGTGLGLPICMRLVKAMKGELWCESREGYGTTVYFTARFGFASEEELAAAELREGALQNAKSGASLTSRSASASGIKVLLVDDISLHQVIALEILAIGGYRVDAVGSGREALEALSRRHYDIVLLDLQMPDMDGFQTAAEIRKRRALQEIPLVAMSARTLQEDRDRCIAAGMNDYVAKPVEPSALYAVLERWSRKPS